MPTSLIIPVIAILATPQVTEGIKEKVLEAENMLSMLWSCA